MGDNTLGYVGKINLIEELVSDWRAGKLTDKAAMIALCEIIEESRKPAIDFTQISDGLAVKFIQEHLAKGGSIEIPSLGIKTNAISPDAGMPQRGVK